MTKKTFQKGDEVVLAQGTYQGTQGVFLRLKDDVNWADIVERNGDIRSHPVIWLAHSFAATYSSFSPTGPQTGGLSEVEAQREVCAR
jgi:hypothetical protein